MDDARQILPLTFSARPVQEVARDLLGRYLVRELADGTSLIVRLVETEAYLGISDRASHAFDGHRTDRVQSLYLAAGHAYVYFVYGMHFCLNVVAGVTPEGGAVLLRAAEPVEGIEQMTVHRSLQRSAKPGDIAGGPAKLCAALQVDREFDGAQLDRAPLYLACGHPVADGEVARGRRIGVEYAGEAAGWPLRFALRGHQHVSRPRP